MRTIFVRPGARRPYVPYGALKDARIERERLRMALEYIVGLESDWNTDSGRALAAAKDALRKVGA